VIAARDRFVLRQPSPARTIGGGVVLDPHPPGRRRRLRPETLDHFAALTSGSDVDIAYAKISEIEPCLPDDLRPEDTGLDAESRDAAVEQLVAQGRVRRVGPLLMTDAGWNSMRTRCLEALRHYHATHPLRGGMPQEELRERLAVPSDIHAALLEAARDEGWLTYAGGSVALPSHTVVFSDAQQAEVDKLMAHFRAQPFTPPSAKEAVAAVGEDVVAALIARGDLVSTAGGEVLFERQAYDEMVAGVLDHLETHGEITVADFRDRFSTSRKYALALLEHLDRIRVTRRVGDTRVRAGSTTERDTQP
jgi:selenocysteine-specific elongation factor